MSDVNSMVQMPQLWKARIDKVFFCKNSVAYEQGHFTEQGYILTGGTSGRRTLKKRVLLYLCKYKARGIVQSHMPIRLKAENPVEKM